MEAASYTTVAAARGRAATLMPIAAMPPLKGAVAVAVNYRNNFGTSSVRFANIIKAIHLIRFPQFTTPYPSTGVCFSILRAIENGVGDDRRNRRNSSLLLC